MLFNNFLITKGVSTMKQWIEKNSWWIRIIVIPLSVIVALGLMSYLGIETRVHADETFLKKETARSDYVQKSEAEKAYVRCDVDRERREREDERWKEIKESLREIKHKLK